MQTPGQVTAIKQKTGFCPNDLLYTRCEDVKIDGQRTSTGCMLIFTTNNVGTKN